MKFYLKRVCGELVNLSLSAYSDFTKLFRFLKDLISSRTQI